MTLDEWCDAMEQARLNDNKKLADDQWLQYVALARQNKGHYINVEQSGNPSRILSKVYTTSSF